MLIRNKLFDTNGIRSYQFDIKTINIGNLSVGGTGKSPHTLWLSNQFRDVNMAVLSRGYKRKSKEFREVHIHSDVTDVGDEPLMMKKYNPSLPIFVEADRVVGVTNIIAELPETQLILLDDCFQHRYIKPSFNILLTTFENPFYEDFVLPSGNLREPRIGAARAQAIIVTKCSKQMTQQQKLVCISKIKKYTHAPVFFSYFKYITPKHIKSYEDLKPNAKIIVLTGLANNSDLVKHLSTHFDVVEIISYPDHHQYNKFNIERLLKKVQALGNTNVSVITTEKDFVKLVNDKDMLKLMDQLPLYIQKVEVDFFDTDGPKLLELICKDYKLNL